MRTDRSPRLVMGIHACTCACAHASTVLVQVKYTAWMESTRSWKDDDGKVHRGTQEGCGKGFIDRLFCGAEVPVDDWFVTAVKTGKLYIYLSTDLSYAGSSTDFSDCER